MPQDMLEVAASLLDRSLQADRNYADLSEQLQIPKHSMSSRSAKLICSSFYERNRNKPSRKRVQLGCTRDFEYDLFITVNLTVHPSVKGERFM